MVFPAGDPAERILLASGGTRPGLLALPTRCSRRIDNPTEIANGTDNAPPEKLFRPRRSVVGSNPLLLPDELRTFDTVRPICDRYSKRFAHLLAPSPPAAAPPPTPIAPTLQPESSKIARRLGIGRTSVWRILSAGWRERDIRLCHHEEAKKSNRPFTVPCVELRRKLVG